MKERAWIMANLLDFSGIQTPYRDQISPRLGTESRDNRASNSQRTATKRKLNRRRTKTWRFTSKQETWCFRNSECNSNFSEVRLIFIRNWNCEAKLEWGYNLIVVGTWQSYLRLPYPYHKLYWSGKRNIPQADPLVLSFSGDQINSNMEIHDLATLSSGKKERQPCHRTIGH